MKRIFLFLLQFLLLSSLWAQIDSLSFSTDLEDEILEIIENQNIEDADNFDFTEEVEVLLQAQGKKCNLNALDAEVAYAILGMSEYQYYQLQLYIEVYGELVSLYELAAVEGFSRADVERLWNLIEVQPARRAKKMFADFFQRSRHNMLLRYGQILEPQKGYDTTWSSGYQGSKPQLVFKYHFQSGEHFALAFAGEKDAGEQFFRGAQKQGFDHYAFFLNIKQVGVIKNCVIGDYNLNFGQGLVVGGRAMGSKGGGAASIRRFPTMLRAVAPMNESTNMRGVAAVLGNAYYSGTIFYGHRAFDGELGMDSLGEICFEGSLSNTGYHRTTSEIEKRKNLWMHLYGAHFQIKRRIFEIGITGVGTYFSRWVSAKEELYRKYGFSGRNVENAGIDYKVILHKTILFGEIGMSFLPNRVGWGMVQGVIVDPDPRCKLSALLRYYDRNYVALQASAFAAGSSCNDELGLYLAADFVTGRRTSLSVHADGYRFSWLKYQLDAPSDGFDIGAKFSVQANRNLQFSLKYQYYYLSENQKYSDYFQSVDHVGRHKGRVAVDCVPTAWLQLKTEGDLVVNARARDAPRIGLLLYQDVALRVERWHFGAKLRLAFFDTYSYAERIYAYEQDLLNSFTIAGYYGKGVRYYLMLSYKYAFFNVQLRFSQTYYDDRTIISSSQAQIIGRTKSDLRIQMNFHLH